MLGYDISGKKAIGGIVPAQVDMWAENWPQPAVVKYDQRGSREFSHSKLKANLIDARLKACQRIHYSAHKQEEKWMSDVKQYLQNSDIIRKGGKRQ